MYFSLLLYFCKFWDSAWFITKLNEGIHVNLNQINIFEIITLNPNHTQNHIRFINLKP
jgi:hypothetical protein